VSDGKVYDVSRQTPAEAAALAAAIASYPSAANKAKVEFIYGQMLHSGKPASVALQQAQRMTT
jgi:hypothetical protein